MADSKGFEEAWRRIKICDGISLDLEGLDLKEIPAVMGNLTNLSTLSLGNNQITEIPAVIGNLTNLSTLYLHNNQISEIPAVIGNLTNLSTLSLGNNQISEIPAVIGNLTNLRELYLYNNQISEIPAVIGNLTNLSTLSLGNNQISEIPAVIGNLTNLRELYLYNNQISEIPAVIGNLTNLSTLYLGDNQVSEIPAVIGNLTNLSTLYLHNNQISEIPAVIGNLTNLSTLSLDNNQITEIPAVIGNLTNLGTLSLRNNLISEIPAVIGNLTNLTELELQSNPLSPEILAFDGNPLGLIRYLREDSAPLREVKLVFVGPPDIGKSCLLRHLQGEKFNPENTTTIGFDVIREQLPLGPEGEDQIQANCWDFGGQQKYEVTHQFFFNPESVYIVAWKPRQDLASLRIWLELIQNRAGAKAPIFVVATRRDEPEHIPTPNQDDLRKQFPGIREFYSVTNLDEIPEGVDNEKVRAFIGQAIEDSKVEFNRLKIDLYEAAKEQMIPRFPVKRREARNEVRDLEATAIGLTECRELFARHINPELTDELLRQLDAIGDIVYHSSADQNNLVVLQPQWLGKAIGFAMGDERLQPGNGKVDHELLVEIWQDHAKEQAYCAEHYPYFLWLMEKFELSYRLSKRQSLIPQLIQSERPTVPFTPETAFTLHPQAAYQWEAKGTNPPRGMLPILTAALDSYRGTSEEQMNWTNGMFITAIEGQRVYIDLKDRVLTLAVRSEYPAYLTERIGGSIMGILREIWPGVTFDLRYPCGKCLMDGKVPLGGFSMAHYAQRPPDFLVICPSCGHESTLGELKQGYQLNLKLILDRLEQAEHDHAEMASIIQNAVLNLANHPNRILLTEGQATWKDVGHDVYALSVYCDHPDHKEPVAVYPIKMPQRWLKTTQSVMKWTGLVAKGFGLIGPSLQFMEHSAIEGLPVIKGEEVKIDLANEEFELIGKGLDAVFGKELQVEDSIEFDSRPSDAHRRLLEHLLDTAAKDGNQYGGLNRELHAGQVKWFCEEHRDKKPEMGPA